MGENAAACLAGVFSFADAVRLVRLRGELFDAILLDAPCSATGTLRRHPDLPFLRDGDALSISCMAAYNDRIIREDDATEDAPADETPAQTITRARITAISRLDLSRPEIGASPCQTDTGACRGTVGLPVWLWVGDGTGGALPSMSTTGVPSISARVLNVGPGPWAA